MLTDDSGLEERILSQVVHEIGDRNLSRELDRGSALMSSGLLDSIATLRVVMYLEQTFAISIEAADLTIENFDSVDRIAGFLRTALALRASNPTAASAAPARR